MEMPLSFAKPLFGFERQGDVTWETTCQHRQKYVPYTSCHVVRSHVFSLSSFSRLIATNINTYLPVCLSVSVSVSVSVSIIIISML